MTLKQDEFWDFSEQVYDAMVVVLGNYNLGRQPVQCTKGYYEKLAEVMVHCMSNTADGWYTRGSHPRTVLFAVAINSVYEFLQKTGPKDEDYDFWFDLYTMAIDEKGIVKAKVELLKAGDEVNIDEYHREVEERLNAIIH